MFSQTHYLGRLRRQIFFSVADANAAKAAALEHINEHVMLPLYWRVAGCLLSVCGMATACAGPCVGGKGWNACVLGNKACRDDFAAVYHRMPRLFTALAAAPMTATPKCATH